MSVLLVFAFLGDSSTAAFPIIFISVLLAILAIIMALAYVMAKKRHAIWKQWAESVGLQYNDHGAKRANDISGVWEGLPVHIGKAIVWGRKSRPVLTFTAFFPQPIGAPFELEKPSSGIKFGTRHFRHRAQFGVEHLDRDFELFTSDPGYISNLTSSVLVRGMLSDASATYENVFINEQFVRLVAPPTGFSTAEWTPILNQVVGMAVMISEIALGSAPQPAKAALPPTDKPNTGHNPAAPRKRPAK